MNVGKAIQQIRVQNNISQETLASDANTTQKHLSRIENNISNISLKTLCKIAHALETKPSEIMRLAESLELNP